MVVTLALNRVLVPNPHNVCIFLMVSSVRARVKWKMLSHFHGPLHFSWPRFPLEARISFSRISGCLCHEIIRCPNPGDITLSSSPSLGSGWFRLQIDTACSMHCSGGFFTLLRRRRSRRPIRLRDWLLVDDGWRALIVPAHVRLDRYGTGGDGVSRRGDGRWVGGRRVDLLRARNIQCHCVS